MDTSIRPYDGPLPSTRAKWCYVSLHIPSGSVTKGMTEETTLAAFLLELDRWNGQQPGTWQYYWARS